MEAKKTNIQVEIIKGPGKGLRGCTSGKNEDGVYLVFFDDEPYSGLYEEDEVRILRDNEEA
jgi:hypothetical protein